MPASGWVSFEHSGRPCTPGNTNYFSAAANLVRPTTDAVWSLVIMLRFMCRLYDDTCDLVASAGAREFVVTGSEPHWAVVRPSSTLYAFSSGVRAYSLRLPGPHPHLVLQKVSLYYFVNQYNFLI